MAIYRVNNDFYTSLEDCKNAKNVNTNKRYKYFCQTHFTAGDEDQFQTYRDQKGDIKRYKESSLIHPSYWIKNKDIGFNGVTNTFNYIFHKFKKGIFVKIKDGDIKVFLPFSKKNFINEWSDRIRLNKHWRSYNDLFQYISKRENRKFDSYHVNKYRESWYGNNGLVRYEYPIYEGDTNVPIISDMLNTLKNERSLPDCEFFINRRDFPIIRKDEKEAYENFFGEDTPLVSHNYDKYAPILSMVERDNYGDIAIPTGDDWSMLTRTEGKFFTHTCKRDYSFDYNIDWDSKKRIAVFRGSSTGVGTTIDTNQRLQLSHLSSLKKCRDKIPYLDCGITEWNLRPRKHISSEYLDIINIEKMPKLVPRLTPKQQSDYKYIIHVEGHVASFRLTQELFYGSVLLIAHSKYRLWIRKYMIPYIHYIPIKEDLSDIYEKLDWCIDNDDKCKDIAKNCLELSKNLRGLLIDHLYNTICNISYHNGYYDYNHLTSLEVLYKLEEDSLDDDIEIKGEIIFKNNKSVIMLNEDKIIKNGEMIHESYINKEFVKKFPYKVFPEPINCGRNTLITSYIKGTTLFDYIRDSPDINIIKNIVKEICCILQIGQNLFFFNHNDLTPWNIILLPCDEVRTYKVFDREYTVSCKYKPIIIDLERASFTDTNGLNYNKTCFKYSSICDILILIYNMFYELCNNNTIHEYIIDVMKFFKDDLNSINKIKAFLTINKKYAMISNSDKGSLETLCPIDLLEYLKTPYIQNNIRGKKCKESKNPFLSLYNILKYGFERDLEDVIKKCEKLLYNKKFSIDLLFDKESRKIILDKKPREYFNLVMISNIRDHPFIRRMKGSLLHSSYYLTLKKYDDILSQK